jgi:hypothetical protein
MRRNLLSILVLALFWTMLCSGSWVQPTENKQAIPKEWRLPTEDELVKNWKWTQKEIIENLKIVGDFDGDRVNDEAQLMVKKDHSAMGLLVVFSPNSPMEYWMLLNIGKPKTLKTYRISLNKPSVYQVSCQIKEPCLFCENKEPCKEGERSISIKTSTIIVNDKDAFIWNKNQSGFMELLNFS